MPRFGAYAAQAGLGGNGGDRAIDDRDSVTAHQARARSDSAVTRTQRLSLVDEAVTFGQPSHGLVVGLLHAVENGVELHAGIVHWVTLAAIEESQTGK
jgi:hypothetical protein